MKPKYESIGVKFHQPQLTLCRDIPSSLGLSQSLVVRAALQIGLEHIDRLKSTNLEEARNLVIIKDAESKTTA